MLEIRGLTKRYPNGTIALANFSLSLGEGVVGGLADLLPFRTSVGDSDGVQPRALLSDRQRGERLVALLQLGAGQARARPRDQRRWPGAGPLVQTKRLSESAGPGVVAVAGPNGAGNRL